MKNVPNHYPVAINIWLLALGYFVFYIPYISLVKALSSGLLERNGMFGVTGEQVSGLELLPAVLIGTVITMPLIIYSLGWYRYMGRRPVFGFALPLPSRWALLSGLAFAAIIATTTLAYSIHGVSIVFALLLMRGGVLILSPIMDKLFNRPVHWYSWTGLGLSILALTIALAQVQEYTVSGLVLILGVYLMGYMFRLQFITRYAKDIDDGVNRRFFVEENSAAMVALMIIPGFIAWLGIGDAGLALREGFTSFLRSDGVWLGLMIGVFYGCLGIFGSLIYLSRRENTFAIPVNRCASLLAGLVASFILMVWLDADGISVSQIIGAAIIIFALMLMSIFDTRHMAGKDNHDPMQRVFLFICDANRTRSPMAAAICNDELRKRLGLDAAVTLQSGIYAKSAGLNLPPERHLLNQTKDALIALTVPVPEHQASQVNSYGMHRAEKIVCMTYDQQQELLNKYPWAAEKIVRLKQRQDIQEPAGVENEHYIDLAHTMQEHISDWLIDMGFSFSNPKSDGSNPGTREVDGFVQ